MRPEISSEREPPSTHTSAKMMNDTTGTAFTAAATGAISSPTGANRAERAARATASTQETAKPPKMWTADVPTAAQKSPVRTSSVNRSRASSGEASSRCPAG